MTEPDPVVKPMTRSTLDRPAQRPGLDSAQRVVAGLEAIIDATAGILTARSLEATLQTMADALAPIVPYTRLAVFEVDWKERVCVPLLCTGSYVEEMWSARPPLEGSATGAAVLRGEVIYEGPDDDDGLAQTMPGTPDDRESILVAPLRIGDEIRGTLNIWRESWDGESTADLSFTPAELILVERFASLATIAYVNASQRDRLRALALTDELTGLFNRRHCQNVLRETLAEGGRHGEPTSVLYLDIDHFKAINDSFGHGVGDDALRAFAWILGTGARAGDLVCRTGGEEFTVVLPRTDAAAAAQVAERIRSAVSEARLGPRRNLTVSVGVATSERSREDLDVLIGRADGALFDAKRGGRDRVVAA